MTSRNELVVHITSAEDLEDVNWHSGSIQPYAVVCVNQSISYATRVDKEGHTFPQWDETLTIPLPDGPINNQTLYFNIYHYAGSEADINPHIGWAQLPLSDVIDEVGIGERFQRSLQVRRRSRGQRRQGKLDVKVTIRDSPYRAPEPVPVPMLEPEPDYPPPDGVTPSAPSRDYSYGANPYNGAPTTPPNPYCTASPSGYPSSAQLILLVAMGVVVLQWVGMVVALVGAAAGPLGLLVFAWLVYLLLNR